MTIKSLLERYKKGSISFAELWRLLCKHGKQLKDWAEYYQESTQ